MVLSRFWLIIIIVSVVYVLGALATGNVYSIDHIVNGKRDDAILIKEQYLQQLPAPVRDSLAVAKDGRYVLHGATAKQDLTYTLDKGVVKITRGKVATDGILPTCKSAIFDLILPLIAYLSFFCGILQLLIDSGASEKLAKLLSPVFVKVFPDVPAKHPAIS